MSIIEDFVSLNAELSKLEQSMAPEASLDLSNSGDVTDEARKALHAMYGIPMGDGPAEIVTFYPGTFTPLVGCQIIEWPVSKFGTEQFYIGKAVIDGVELPEVSEWTEVGDVGC